VSPAIAKPSQSVSPEATPIPEESINPEETLVPEVSPTPEETLAPEATPEPGLEAEPEVEAIVTTEQEGSNVNIRAAASADAEILGQLTSGMRVTVLGVEGDWVHVRADGIVGYVHSNFLSVPEPEAEETVMPEPTLTVAPVEQKIILSADRDVSTLVPGDVLTLSAQLVGFDGGDYSLIWQEKTKGGSWQDIDGATDTTLTIHITEAHDGCSWRLQANTNG
jgi:hypothetical protein